MGYALVKQFFVRVHVPMLPRTIKQTCACASCLWYLLYVFTYIFTANG